MYDSYEATIRYIKNPQGGYTRELSVPPTSVDGMNMITTVAHMLEQELDKAKEEGRQEIIGNMVYAVTKFAQK